MSNFMKHFSHEHPLLSRIRKLIIKINCALCQLSIGDDYESYGCIKCYYFLHKACAELPQLINDHPLHPPHSPLLLAKLPSNYTSKCYYCDNSFQNREHLAYTCMQCSFSMHTTCALIPVPTITCEENKDNDPVQYVCHQNLMALVEQDNSKSQAKCIVCQSFWSGLAYSCTSIKCNNFLHKYCAEFSLKIQHPFHSHHPLTLQFSKPQSCNLCCKKDCRLIFKCHNGCNFNLGAECFFFRTTVKCQSHDHLLSFVEKAFVDIQCDACRKSFMKSADHLVPSEVNRTQSFIFRCMQCDFNLHFLCGPLPTIIEFDFHIHPLNLVDHSETINDDSSEHYCDVCEEERNPSFRIYYCKHCKYGAHIHCLISEIMKVIKGKNEDVKLWTLGENRWYEFIGSEKEMLKDSELTLREVMSSLTKQEKELLVDPFEFSLPSLHKTQIKEKYSFYMRENSPLFDHELRSIENINRIHPLSRFCAPDLLNFIMEVRYYRPREGLKLDEKYLRQKAVDVEGYMVPITLVHVLKTLLHKHGSDLFGGGHSNLTCGMKSVIATLLCVVSDRIYNTNIEDVTRDDLKDWIFCLKAIRKITNFRILRLDYHLETVVLPIFFGFEAIRNEKDIYEKLDLRITNLEAELERCKETRVMMLKTQTSNSSDPVKDSLINRALKLKGKNVGDNWF